MDNVENAKLIIYMFLKLKVVENLVKKMKSIRMEDAFVNLAMF